MKQYTKVIEKRNIDELVILDITATREQRCINNMSHYINELFCPTSIGGGIRSVEDAKNLFDQGADKVVIGNGIFDMEGEKEILTPLIDNLARKFGSQAVTVSLNVNDNHAAAIYDNEWMVLGHHYIEDVAYACEQEGAGEILLTTIYNEAEGNGYDLRTIEKVANKVRIPVIANGGCGKPEHMKEAINAGASAVAAGSMFLFTEVTPRICAEYLHAEGFPVRLM